MNTKTPKYWVILPAAGIGSRMQADRPKQYLRINQRLLIDYTLEQMLAYPHFSGVVLVLSANDAHWPSSEFYQDPRIQVVEGGAERCYSVLNGLQAVHAQADAQDWVLVHDVARPCIQSQDLDKLILDNHPDGALLAMPVRDTMKRGDAQQNIVQTVERKQLWHALTPQKFRYQALINSLTQCLEKKQEVTDEASAMELCGFSPRLIEGRGDNIKVTRPDDLALAQFFLTQQSRI